MTRFDVQVFRDGRWILETAAPEEAKARALFQGLVGKQDNDGCRIVKAKRRPDGSYDEEVLIETLKTGEKKKDLSVGTIAQAPLCETLADLYRPASRNAMARLLAKFLDDLTITPTELLHDPRHGKKAMETGLAAEAVDRVATLQAAQTQTDTRARRDALFTLVEQATARARKAAENKDLPPVPAGGFAAAVAAIDAKAGSEDRDFLALVALTRALVDLRIYSAKVAFVVAEIARAGEGRAQALLDGVLADLCDAKGVLAEMIGAVPNLATYLVRLEELAGGKLKLSPANRPKGDPLAAINALIAAGRLPETRASLIDQFQRQLRAGQPLVRSEPKAEFDAFRQLLERVVTKDDIFGGPPAAEALVLRYAGFLSTGGAPGRREAIAAVTNHLPSAMQQVRMLIALTETELGREQMDFTIKTLEGFIENAKRMEDLVGLQGTPKTRMQEIAAIYAFLRATDSLPARIRGPLADKLDALVAKFLIDNQVIEKLDNPADSLRVRAVRLVQFCTSGVLTEGKASTMARDRVLAILRQPNFEAKFVADIPDPATKEKSLREFHQLLASSSFLAQAG